MNEEWLLCPTCGWSGPTDKLGGDGSDAVCPACDERIRRAGADG